MKVLLGAAVGAGAGWVLSRMQTCSVKGCHVRASTIFSMIGGAVFGAAVAWYLLTKQ